METVGNHADVSAAAGRPLRRARFAAWSVFLGMAGTTMAFQVFHAVATGQMPWPLAVLYGVVPLAISIGVLAFAAHWPSRWAQTGAYLITAGAMYMSAAATGTVTLHAAAPHAELLFGFILDGAALLAIRFIFDGPSAAQAVAEVAQREAELTAKADGERSARERAEAAHRTALADLRTRAEAEIGRLNTAHETGQRDLETARGELAEALRRAEALTAKLATATAQKKRAKAPVSARPASGESDPTNELRAVMELLDKPHLLQPRMSGELARELTLSPATGRRLHNKLVKDGALTEYAQSLMEPSAERSQ